MKTLFVLFLFACAHLVAQAQDDSKVAETKPAETKAAPTSEDASVAKPLVIEDATKAMSKGTQPGFKIDIHNATKKGVWEALEKAMKDENKAKVEQVGNEHFVNGVIIERVSPKPLNVYVLLNEYEGHTEMYTFYEMDSAFLTKEKNESEYVAARKFTRDFAVKAYRGAVQEHIDAEGDKLKQLQSELDKIHKEHDNLEKKISSENQAIDNTKEKIATSELDQERVRGQVQSQKTTVSTTKAGGNETLLKEEEKKLKTMEGELSKLQKQEDGFHKDITNSEAAIRDYERDITNNQSAAATKQAEVDKQKELISKLGQKLGSIK